MGFNSSHSLAVSCNLLLAGGQIGASIGAVARKFSVARDARLYGKAEAEGPIFEVFSIIQSLANLLSMIK